MTAAPTTPRTRTILLTVSACLVPGLVLQALLLDPAGVLQNVLVASVTAMITERTCAGPAAGRLARTITDDDASALVTGLILAAALPPGSAAPLVMATVAALALGKHAYGGLGNNVFNPAMVGYAVVLVSFPDALARWPAAWGASVDGLTGATVLTTFKYRGAATVEDVWLPGNGFGALAGAGYEWIALAYAAGGLWLFFRGFAAWRPAAGMLLALTLASLATYDNGSSASLGSPAYHLLGGSALLAAAFVVTDPVTHPATHRGQWLFGLLVGAMIFSVRAWGNYPDGIAFAVLLGNAVTPYLDLPAGSHRG